MRITYFFRKKSAICLIKARLKKNIALKLRKVNLYQKEKKYGLD